MVSHLKEFSHGKGTQDGLLSGRSCNAKLLAFLDYVTSFVDEGYLVDSVHLDFQNVFDKVPYKWLVKKLYSYGILGKISQWIENWLRDREQGVVLNGATSE